MPNALHALNPPNQNQLYLILNNAGYSQPNQANALGLNSYQGRPLMVLREDQMQNALGAAPGFAPGELEANALRAMDLGGNIGTSMMPGMGDVRDLGEAIQGRDWWTGQQLSGPERLMSAGAAAIPFVGAGMGRAIGQVTVPFAEDLKRAIQAPEFKNWFGKSAVVDEAGEPMAVYHGTPADFESFDPGKTVLSSLGSSGGLGVFFTRNPVEAGHYAGYDKSGKIVPAFLSLQNPIVIEPMSDIENRMYRSKRSAINLRKDLMAAGYDGAITPLNEIVVFSPNQIKSIWNRGTWDPNKPEISW